MSSGDTTRVRGKVKGSGLRAVISGLGAAILFGTWAGYVNRDAETAVLVRAVLTQAGLSAASTTAATLLIELLFNVGTRPVVRFLLGGLGASLCVLGIMATAHAIVGTSRVLATIAPSAVTGTTYCLIYSAGLLTALRRQERSDQTAPVTTPR